MTSERKTDQITIAEAFEASGKKFTEVGKEIGVHHQTVRRWVHEGTAPRDDKKIPLAEALCIDPLRLWPSMDISSDGSEVIETWKHLKDVPSERWQALVHNSTGRTIDILAGSGTLLTEGVPRLRDAIRGREAGGTSIRICLGDPESEHTKYRDSEEGLEGTFPPRIKKSILEWSRMIEGLQLAELRTYSAPFYHDSYRFNGSMLVINHAFAQFGTESPAMLLHRTDNLGMYDNYVETFERVWKSSSHVAGGTLS